MSILKDFEDISNEQSRFKRTWMRIFQIFCNLTALGLTGWCFYKFMKDDDVSLVNYQRYHADIDSIYPSCTLCFNNPFLEDKLRGVGVGINTTTYVKFLEGQYWDDRLVNIDYDNVTIDLKDYLDMAQITLANGTAYNNHGKMLYYVGMRSPRLKCFSFDIPFISGVGVAHLAVTIRNSIFPFGFRPPHHDFNISTGRGGGFEVRFNLPRQIFRSDLTNKWIWEPLEHDATKKWVGMTFKVKTIEVLKRRSKSAFPCNDDWRNDDQKIIQEILRKVQCKPPFWNTSAELNFCTWVVAVQLIYFSNSHAFIIGIL